jgi:hypothetical protein
VRELPPLQLPDPDERVGAERREVRAIGVEGERGDRATRLRVHDTEQLVARHVPQLDAAVSGQDGNLSGVSRAGAHRRVGSDAPADTGAQREGPGPISVVAVSQTDRTPSTSA